MFELVIYGWQHTRGARIATVFAENCTGMRVPSRIVPGRQSVAWSTARFCTPPHRRENRGPLATTSHGPEWCRCWSLSVGWGRNQGMVVTCRWLFVIRCFVACCLWFVVCCLLLVGSCLSFPVCCVLLVASFLFSLYRIVKPMSAVTEQAPVTLQWKKQNKTKSGTRTIAETHRTSAKKN